MYRFYIYVVLLIMGSSLTKAQNYIETCSQFYQATQATTFEGFNVREIKLNNLVDTLDFILPNNTITKTPHLLMLDSSQNYDPESTVSVVCVDEKVFIYSSQALLILDLVKREMVQTQERLGVPSEVWRLNNELYVISFVISTSEVYSAFLHLSTGKVTLLNNATSNLQSSRGLPVTVALVVGNKILLQESVNMAVANEDSQPPYIYGFTLFGAKDDSLTELAKCEVELSENFSLTPKYALSNQGLTAFEQQQETMMYHYQLLSTCQEVADLLRQ